MQFPITLKKISTKKVKISYLIMLVLYYLLFIVSFVEQYLSIKQIILASGVFGNFVIVKGHICDSIIIFSASFI